MGLLRTHTTVRNNIKVERNSTRREYATVIRNEVRKGKASQREQRHAAQTQKSRHRHQMLEGDQDQTSTKQPKGFLHWKMVW
jgi:hypothetical protein